MHGVAAPLGNLSSRFDFPAGAFAEHISMFEWLSSHVILRHAAIRARSVAIAAKVRPSPVAGCSHVKAPLPR
jgi:hypothetical protein